MEGARGLGGWRGFWSRGGWWRAAGLAAVYFVVYEGGSLLFLPLVGMVPARAGALRVLVVYGLPILLGGILLVVFAWSVGWLRGLFAREPVRGRRWMWVAVAVVLAFNLLRYAALDYSSTGGPLILTWLLVGLFIGFAEEILTRGIVVQLLRLGAHREISVAVISAAIFAGLHAGNILAGQSVFVTGLQLAYTFAFGVCMYLALRVTRTLIAPVLLHASTDPSIFLLAEHPAASPVTAVANIGNFAVIAAGLLLLIFIRGRIPAQVSIPTAGPVR